MVIGGGGEVAERCSVIDNRAEFGVELFYISLQNYV